MRPPVKILLIVPILLSGLLLQPPVGAEVVDKVLVIVNDEIITRGEVDRVMGPVYLQNRKLYTEEEEFMKKMDEAYRNVLDQMINDKLLLSEARRRKIEATDKEAQEKVNLTKKHFPTEEEFNQTLKNENMVLSQLEKMYKERIMIDKLIEMEIRKKTFFTPNEVLRYYEKNKNLFTQPRKIKLRTILIKVNEKRSDEEASKLAEGLLSKLNGGAGFDALAREYSEGPYKDTGGDMGWVSEGELIERINEAVFNLDENEVSNVLKTDLGYHIFKVEGKLPSKAKEFNEAKQEVERMIFNNRAQEKLKEFIARLRKDAYIEFR